MSMTEKERAAIAYDSLVTGLIKLTAMVSDRKHAIMLLRDSADDNSSNRDDQFTASICRQCADYLEHGRIMEQEYNHVLKKISHGCMEATCPLCDGDSQ